MAKSTDSTDVNELDEDLDTGVDEDEDLQDETQEDDTDSDTDDDEETDDESDDSDDEDEDEDSEGFKKRLTQFKGDTPAEYAKSVEDGYLESSKEAVKLAKENKDLKAALDKYNKLIAEDPELAKTLQAEPKKTEPKDPAIAWAEAERDKQWAADYSKFKDLHPEIETDPQLSEQLNTQLLVVKNVIEQSEGRLVGMAEGLEKAWKLLGKDDTEEKVRMAAKDTASKGKTASSGKPEASKVKFTDAQIAITMDMMGLSRNEAIKEMSKYNK